MLFINDERLNVEQFVTRMNELTGKKIDLEELKKNPSFSSNEAIAGIDFRTFATTGRRVPKYGEGSDILTVFRFFSTIKEQQVEVRYASRMPHNDFRSGNKVYTPRHIDVDPRDFGFTASQIEAALYMYVHPDCKQSPVRDETKVHKYSHNSLKANIQAKDNKVKILEACLLHATNLIPEEVKLMAKGLGINVDERYSSEEIRSEIKSFILENSAKYYESMQTESVKFLGLVQDCIDNNYISGNTTSGQTVWSYNQGPSKGRQIVAIASDVEDPIKGLKDYLIENIASHYGNLVGMHKGVVAAQKAEDFLKTQKTGEVNEEVYSAGGDTMELSDVVDFKSAATLLELVHPEGKKSSMTKTKQFLEAVQSGEINEDNVSEKVVDYIAKLD